MFMKKWLFLFLLLFYSLFSFASGKDSVIRYIIPDSLRAVSFMADVTVNAVLTKKEVFTGIRTDNVSLTLEADKNKRELVFSFPKTAAILATGLNVKSGERGELEFDYNWKLNKAYRLMITIAADSANNFMLYSGYIRLDGENDWKLMGTCKIEGNWKHNIQVATLFADKGKKHLDVSYGEVWCQRRNGSWKNLKENSNSSLVINLLSHVDSLQQLRQEIKWIKENITNGITDVRENVEEVYFKLMHEGTGRQVALTDTVTVHYKGYLFNDGSIFDETKDQPATFPLNRLIRGWQLGVPLCKIGGKIKLVIPSALAYSIRTRSPRIPPNSILVFEVEVVDAKAAQ